VHCTACCKLQLQLHTCVSKWTRDKMRSGPDLNSDNLRISRAYLRISDHCMVTVGVIADCCIQTAGERDKMRINHVIKTDQWRTAPLRILSCPFKMPSTIKHKNNTVSKLCRPRSNDTHSREE